MAIEVLKEGNLVTIEAAQGLSFVGACNNCEARYRALGSDCGSVRFTDEWRNARRGARFCAVLFCQNCQEPIYMREERASE